LWCRSSGSCARTSHRWVWVSLAHAPNDAARDSIPIEPAAPLVLHLPRLRALALLRRRPAARVESTTSRRPRKLHINGCERPQQSTLTEILLREPIGGCISWIALREPHVPENGRSELENVSNVLSAG
jgi:hypothetical protein